MRCPCVLSPRKRGRCLRTRIHLLHCLPSLVDFTQPSRHWLTKFARATLVDLRRLLPPRPFGSRLLAQILFGGPFRRGPSAAPEIVALHPSRRLHLPRRLSLCPRLPWSSNSTRTPPRSHHPSPTMTLDTRHPLPALLATDASTRHLALLPPTTCVTPCIELPPNLLLPSMPSRPILPSLWGSSLPLAPTKTALPVPRFLRRALHLRGLRPPRRPLVVPSACNAPTLRHIPPLSPLSVAHPRPRGLLNVVFAGTLTSSFSPIGVASSPFNTIFSPRTTSPHASLTAPP